MVSPFVKSSILSSFIAAAGQAIVSTALSESVVMEKIRNEFMEIINFMLVEFALQCRKWIRVLKWNIPKTIFYCKPALLHGQFSFFGVNFVAQKKPLDNRAAMECFGKRFSLVDCALRRSYE